jgi:hypothetical protein
MVELDNSHFRKLFSADFTPKYRLTVAQDKIIVRHQGGDKALKTFSQAFDPQREGVSRSVLDGVFSFRCIAPWDVSRLACQVVHTGSRATVYTAAVEVRGLPIGQVGLFAGRDIRAGEVVGLYSGQVEVYNRPLGASDDDYAWAVQIKEPSHYLTDLPTERSKHLRVRGGIARNELAHVNHSSNPNLISIQVSDGRHPYIAFLSPMDIPQHSHLTIDYGKGYWLDRRISPVDMAGVEPKPIEAPFSV